MKMADRITTAARLLLLAVIAGLAPAALAQPADKPMRIIVPYAAGGVTDAVARAMAARLSESMGRPVLVDNRPGGSSIIGMQACAKAEPDGLTTCLTVADSLSYNPAMFNNLPYDPEKDFAPVINLGFANNLLVANAAAPFNTFKEMVAYAKTHPGVLNWATWGTATIPDVYARWVAHQAGINIVPIPYKGSAGTIPAVLSGEAHITFMGFGSAMPHIKAGKLKPLVAIGTQRSSIMPSLPTLAEEGGDPGLVTYFGVFAPGATPKPVLDRLNAEFAKALRTPQGQEFLKNYTLDAVANTVEQFTAFTRSDRENAAKVFRSIGIKPAAAP
jgi:tripartite-type tricarboxylate transporter receptor subunit TctC